MRKSESVLVAFIACLFVYAWSIGAYAAPRERWMLTSTWDSATAIKLGSEGWEPYAYSGCTIQFRKKY